MKSVRWRFLSSHVFPLALIVVAALASPAWAPLERHATGELVVFAAASLTEPFTEIGQRLEAAHPGFTITFNFSGSAALRTQLELEKDVLMIPIPEAYNQVASYPIAVPTQARNPSAAQLFVAFVLSQEGQTILLAHGFRPVTGEPPTRENLLEKRISITIANGSLYDFVLRFRQESHIPISFIDAENVPEKTQLITLHLRETTLRSILDIAVSQNSAYQYDVILNRLVLYPRLPKYAFVATNIQIHQVPR